MTIRSSFVFLLPLWLMGVLIAPNLTSVTNSMVQIVAIVWFTGVCLFLAGPRFFAAPVFRESPLVAICLATFLMTVLPGSILNSVAPVASIGFWATTLIAVVTGAGFWGLTGYSDVKRALIVYSLVGIPLLALLFLPGYSVDLELLITGYSSERLGGFRNPNSVGMIMMGFLLCAFMIPSRTVKVPLFGLGGVILLLTLSRSAIFGTTIAFSILAAFHWKHMHPRTRLAVVGAGMVTGCFIAVLYGGLILQAVDTATGLSDPTRGWGNFTNRMGAWIETFNLWLDHPLLGVGYRAHEPHLTTLSSAHNGYLALLAETGLFGAVPMMLFMVSSALRVLRIGRQGFLLGQVGFALLCGMAFISFFERSMINFGNPSSILQLLILLMPSPTSDVEPDSAPK